MGDEPHQLDWSGRPRAGKSPFASLTAMSSTQRWKRAFKKVWLLLDECRVATLPCRIIPISQRIGAQCRLPKFEGFVKCLQSCTCDEVMFLCADSGGGATVHQIKYTPRYDQ